MASRGRGFGGPRPGETLTGMVKSYNRKGFGFIMCQQLDADVYFSRESLAPQLQTSDLAGEYVTFEVHRFPDGKLQARNLRAVGETGISRGPDGFGGAKGGKGFKPGPPLGGRDEEDRSRDWYCEGCGERNFVKRAECFKCKTKRPSGADTAPIFVPPPRRTLSPHAGSRALRELFQKGRGKGGSRSRSRSRRKRRSPSRKRGSRSEKKKSSGSSSSEGSSRKRRKRSSASGSPSSGSSSGSPAKGPATSKAGEGPATASSSAAAQDTAPAPSNSSPETEKAKAEVLEKLLKLREVEPREARIRDWRALLREWHPDKNPDRVEVATAVFQFLQKGKLLIDTEGK